MTRTVGRSDRLVIVDAVLINKSGTQVALVNHVMASGSRVGIQITGVPVEIDQWFTALVVGKGGVDIRYFITGPGGLNGGVNGLDGWIKYGVEGILEVNRIVQGGHVNISLGCQGFDRRQSAANRFQIG